MKYYNRRNYSDYRRDLGRAKEFGMPDMKDAFMSSKEFSIKYSKHLIDIAQRKNTEYSATGVLDTLDLIQMTSWCFVLAWKHVNWERIGNTPEGEREKALWGFIKKSVVLRLPMEIRKEKDGIRMTYHQHLKRLNSKDYKNSFDAISTLFPQLSLEMSFADAAISDDGDYYNDWKIDIITEWFSKFLNSKEIDIVSMSLGIDCEPTKLKELSERFEMGESAVKMVKSRGMKKLRSEEAMRWLALTLDGASMNDRTGANFLEFLK